MNIREYLKNNRLLCDGAFSTYYNELNGAERLPEYANINNPDSVYEVHSAYVKAGARLIRTNTFAANTASLKCDESELRAVIEGGYSIAQRAAEGLAFVAADIGQLPQGADKGEYKQIADIFVSLGAKIYLFETMDSLDELLPALEHIKASVEDSFVIVQFCVNQHGYSATGESASGLIRSCNGCEYIDAMGFNCGVGPAHLYNIYKGISLDTDKYLTALPNSGYPSVVRERMVFLDNINYFTEVMCRLSALGIDMIGGCCGTTPGYISSLADRVDLAAVKHDKRISHYENKAAEEPKNNLFYANKKAGEKIIAVELDPPKDADCTTLMETANYLKHHGVDVITFADSPSGRTRAASILMSLKVKNETGISVMPHICCRDTNAIGLTSKLLGAYINNIKNFLIITGDPVPSTARESVKSVFNFDSTKLMRLVERLNDDNFPNDRICFGGALGYDKPNLEVELKRARLKEEAGAQFFLTQPVYDKEDAAKLRYMKQHLSSKVLVGIMPLVSYTNANFIKNEITGIRVPDSVLARFSPDMPREESRRVGIDICRAMMKECEDFADGYYFTIPFNRLAIAKELLK